MSNFALDGREYNRLAIMDYKVKMEVLDGEGAGRTKAQGWPLIRDPQGTILNLSILFRATTNENQDFIHLWQTCKRMGKDEFVKVKFIDPLGEVIEQRMYLVAAELAYRRIEDVAPQGFKVFSDSLAVSFIAERGV